MGEGVVVCTACPVSQDTSIYVYETDVFKPEGHDGALNDFWYTGKKSGKHFRVPMRPEKQRTLQTLKKDLGTNHCRAKDTTSLPAGLIMPVSPVPACRSYIDYIVVSFHVYASFHMYKCVCIKLV